MIERRDVTFVSGWLRCGAWLYLPEGPPAPVIILGRGLGGVREMRLDAYAERFTAAGYACLVFDYRYFGVRTVDSVDGYRIILWGNSVGRVMYSSQPHEMVISPRPLQSISHGTSRDARLPNSDVR